MNPLRILLADDHEIVRRGLVSLLKSHAGWEVCAEAQDGRQAVQKAKELRPEVVILDIGMPNLNGLEAARQILHDNAQSKVLILTITNADEMVRAVLAAGCGTGRKLVDHRLRYPLSGVAAPPAGRLIANVSCPADR